MWSCKLWVDFFGGVGPSCCNERCDAGSFMSLVCICLGLKLHTLCIDPL